MSFTNMNDEKRLHVFQHLLVYLIASFRVMSDMTHVIQPGVDTSALFEMIDEAKILLTQVPMWLPQRYHLLHIMQPNVISCRLSKDRRRKQ